MASVRSVWKEIDFNGATLYFSHRSPFARRVRLAFLEHGIQYTGKVVDVFRPNPELIPINLLSRVPTLVLRSGAVLPDSNVILSVFYDSIESSPLRPKCADDLLKCLEWSGLAYGVIEKSVENFLESLRPEEMRDFEIFDEISELVARFLARLERTMGHQDFLIAGQLTQADLDIGSALAYLELRYDSKVLKRWPGCEGYLRRLEGRETFQKTSPHLD